VLILLPCLLTGTPQTHFGLALLPELPGENVLFSPYSMTDALLITQCGARGKTRDEITSVIGNAEYRSTSSQNIHSVNSVFIDTKFSVKPTFMQALNDMNTPLNSIDFSDSYGAANTINNWVSKETKDAITQIIRPSDITPDTTLTMVNATHFEAEWLKPFDPNHTTLSLFETGKHDLVEVEMMQETSVWPYGENEIMQVVELCYNNNLSMVLLLPHEHHSLEEVEQSLETGLNLHDLQPEKIVVRLPKFKLETSYENLVDILGRLGMPTAFSSQADFSGISDEPLRITKIIHKASIEVGEQGTKASASTAIMMGKGISGLYSDTPIFNADRPFMFLIIDRNNEVPFFIGKVNNPTC